MDGLWKLALPVAAILAAAACGGGGDNAEETFTTSPTASVLQENTPPQQDDANGNGDGGQDEQPPCTPQTYQVQSGDTLSAIAVEFGVSVEAIAGASGVDNPNLLSVGQELTIPCPGQLPATPQPDGAGATSPTPES